MISVTKIELLILQKREKESKGFEGYTRSFMACCKAVMRRDKSGKNDPEHRDSRGVCTRRDKRGWIGAGGKKR